MGRLKLWLLDADVIIDLLGLNIFDKLVKIHQVHVASTVVREVRFYRRDGEKVSIDFHKVYVGTGRVKEALASTEELREIVKVLPEIKREGLHPGELESIAILLREESLTFCSCDAATIRHQAVAIADLGTLRGRLFISPGIHLNTEGMKMLIVLYLTMQCNCSSIALQWMDGKKEGMTCLVN